MYLSTIVWYAKEDKIEKIARIIEINIEEKNKQEILNLLKLYT